MPPMSNFNFFSKKRKQFTPYQTEIKKTYKTISLSNLAVERRQCIIINKLNGLKNENRIESKIRISSIGFIKIVEIRNLTPKRLKNASTIFFKESWNFL